MNMPAQNVVAILLARPRPRQVREVVAIAGMVPTSRLNKARDRADYYQRLYVQNTSKWAETRNLLNQANEHIAGLENQIADFLARKDAQLLAEAMSLVTDMVLDNHALSRALGDSVGMPSSTIEFTAKGEALIKRAATLLAVPA